MTTVYRVWVATVSEDGELSVSFHKTEGSGWSDIIEAYGHVLSEEINIEEILKRIEALSEDDIADIQEQLADYSIDAKVEEHTISSDMLRRIARY